MLRHQSPKAIQLLDIAVPVIKTHDGGHSQALEFIDGQRLCLLIHVSLNGMLAVAQK